MISEANCNPKTGNVARKTTWGERNILMLLADCLYTGACFEYGFQTILAVYVGR